MRYPLSDSDNQLPSLPSVSPKGSPQPPSDPELTLQEVNSPVHSTPSTPEVRLLQKGPEQMPVRVMIQMRMYPLHQMQEHLP